MSDTENEDVTTEEPTEEASAEAEGGGTEEASAEAEGGGTEEG